MVSQRRPPRPTIGSRDRLLAAATAEFSARGFDGAKVDRIAAKARVNKAMLYYHFRNKAALYREILGELFHDLARAVDVEATRTGVPEERLRQFVRIVAAETARSPLFPSLWLREMGEGGRHLDAGTLRPIGAVLQVLGAILREGQAAGRFRPAHPVVVQMAIVAPLLLFAASEPTRERHRGVIPGATGIPREDLVAHVEAATLAALAADPPKSTARPSTAARRSRR